MAKTLTGIDRLLAFMLERHQIYLRRFVEKLPPPWTDDPILRKFKFTNIYRELDTVTIWIREHIREPYAKHPNLWFMLCLARQINWPDTLQELMDKGAWPVDTWNPRKARAVMLARKARGDKLYTGAYMLTAHKGRDPATPPDKAYLTCYPVLTPLWKEREKIALPALEKKSLQAFCEMLKPYHGWGGFTSYEVACDLRWTRYLKDASDINTWANAGPGAVRGLNRVFGREPKASLNQKIALDEMRLLQQQIQKRWPKAWPALELREIEHSLCEFYKMEKVRLGEGRPRSLFNSGNDK